MPSKRKSNKQSKKPKHFTANTTTQQPNHHSSNALQFPGKGELKVLREQNGRCGSDNDSLKPNNSEKKCVCLVVEEEKRKNKEVKGFSVSVSLSSDRNQMEGSALDGRFDLLQETQKLELEESQNEDKGVIDVVEEDDVKSIVESAAETLDGEDLNVVVESEETNSVLVDSEKVEETKEASDSEPILSTPNDDSVIDATESKLKENQEKDLVIPEKTDDERVEVKELNSEISSGLANIVRSRETEKAVETTEDSSEEKDELSSVVAAYGVVPRAIEETTIVKPDESEEPELLVEDEKVGESSSVVQEPSKDQDVNESLQTLTNVAATETSGSTVQDKTEIHRSTEYQTTPSVAQRQYTSWSSCCGLFEILRGGDR